MEKTLFLFVCIILFSINAFADIRLPDNIKPTPAPKSGKTGKKVPMTIRINPNVDEPTLKIPRSALRDLRARLDEIENANSNRAAINSVSGTQTLMSGLFFSIAMIFGGVWMFRGKPLEKNQKIISGLMIFAFLGASIYTVFANAAPPPLQGISADLFSDKMRSRWTGATGTVKIEIDNSNYQDSPIQLIIPRDDEKNGKSEE